MPHGGVRFREEWRSRDEVSECRVRAISVLDLLAKCWRAALACVRSETLTFGYTNFASLRSKRVGTWPYPRKGMLGQATSAEH